MLSRSDARDERPHRSELAELEAALRTNLADWPLDDLVPELDWSRAPAPRTPSAARASCSRTPSTRVAFHASPTSGGRAPRPPPTQPWRAGRRPPGRRIVLSSFGFDDAGGGTIVPRYVAKELAQRGHEVTVFAAGVARLEGEPAYAVRTTDRGRRRGRLGAQPPARAARSRAPAPRAGRSAIRAAFAELLDRVRPRRRAPAQPAQPRAVARRRDVLARHPHGLLDPQLLARLRAQLPLPRRPLAVRRPGRRRAQLRHLRRLAGRGRLRRAPQRDARALLAARRPHPGRLRGDAADAARPRLPRPHDRRRAAGDARGRRGLGGCRPRPRARAASATP